MSDERPSAAEAFALLGDANRVEILRVLDRASRGEALAFSDVYAETDLTDSAQFNYHLKKLAPQFVTKTDGGYRLTTAGWRVARAVAAGRYHGRATVDPVEVEGACRHCGAGRLEASYEDESLSIDCLDCGESVLSVGFPPSGVADRTPREMLDAFDRWSRLQVEQARSGVCPSCAGKTAGAVTDDVSDDLGFDVLAQFACGVCDREMLTSFGALAYRIPPVRRFHRRRGVDLRDRPYWQIPQFVTDDHTTVHSRDPWRVGVAFHVEGETCRVTFDGDLSILDVTADDPAGASGDART